MESASIMNIKNFIFQQDNDPKHTSGIIKEFLSSNNIHTVNYTPQSPDLNPIEHLWAYIKQKISDKNFQNKEDLITEVFRVWNNIPVNLCQKLVLSMKKCVKELFLAKGKNIDY